MWSWLKKLMNNILDSEQENPNDLSAQSTTRQPQARTKSIYPRERERERQTSRARVDKDRVFRFPVIPDQKSIKQKEATVEEKKPLTHQPKIETGPRVKTEAPVQKEKRAFTPMEVISPIYGTLKEEQQARSRKMEERAEQHHHNNDKVDQASDRENVSLEWQRPLDYELLLGKKRRLDNVEAHPKTEEPAYSPEPKMEHADWAYVPPIEHSADTHADDKVEEELGPKLQDFEEQPLSYTYHLEEELEEEIEELIDEPAAPILLEETAAAAEVTPLPMKAEAKPEPEREPEPTSLYVHSWKHQSTPAVAAPAWNSPHVDQVDHSYTKPSLDLLNPSPQLTEDYYEYTLEQKQLLEDTLVNFNVSAQVVGIVKGPSVTRFELQPAPGVKVNKITGLTDDIKLNLAAKDIRIEAPIPGRNAVGIEVPNIKSEAIFISRIIGSDKFQEHPSPMAIALGMDIGGEPIVADIKKMPHGLIAGSTGSGKSVCINSIIVSLLYKATPEQVRLLLIDPKMVELAPYNNLPHLVTPVVTDAKQATAALKWAVEEMEKRYALFVDAGVRDIDRYNLTTDEPLPYIVIIIDELADLMMVSPQDVEDCIIRIAQKARACGIHLLLATQRPSVDVITGNIKANVPTRLAFAVFSQVDSRTILDQSGAERLLGRGDMLFLESGATPLRLQGNYVSDDEIERVTQIIKKQRKPEYLFSREELEQSVQSYDMGDDPLYHEALMFVADQGHASASGLQRRFRIGYNRAARLIEMMESEGHVAGQTGGKPRAVLISKEDAQALTEGTSLL